MIEFYGLNDSDPEEITEIYGYDSGEVLQQIPANEINQLNERIRDEVDEWREEAKANYQDRKQIEREVRSMRY